MSTSSPLPLPTPNAAGHGLVGKHRNVVLVWLVWPFITLGIYHLVWWYKINREVREFDNRIKVSPGVAVLAFFPGFLLIVPPFVSVYRTGDRIRRAQQAAGMQTTTSPGIGLLLAFIFSLYALYYQSELNSLWATYGSPPESTPVALHA